METMLAYQTRTYGPDAKFEPVQTPVPKIPRGHVLIEVKATSLNPVDNKLLRNDLGVNPKLPATLHGDVAGVIADVAEGVTEFVVGDEVYACAGCFFGTADELAELMPADARLVAKKPTTLNFLEAAGLPLVSITAWESLVDSAKIESGEHVLVHGGTGGLGHVAVQLAKARGSRVSTTVSSDESAQFAYELGADDCVNCLTEDVTDYVNRLTSGAGFDLVYDTVGGVNLEQSLLAVRNYGRVVTVYTGTEPTTADLGGRVFQSRKRAHAEHVVTAHHRPRAGTLRPNT